jgi:hypothetical protein
MVVEEGVGINMPVGVRQAEQEEEPSPMPILTTGAEGALPMEVLALKTVLLEGLALPTQPMAVPVLALSTDLVGGLALLMVPIEGLVLGTGRDEL